MNAQELYWQGVELYGEECETKAACDASKNKFELALVEDDKFARAHGWLAYVLAQGYYRAFYPASVLPSAEEHATVRVTLAGSDYENLWSLADVQQRMGKFQDAYDSYKAAEALNGNDANLLANFSELLNRRGERKKIDEDNLGAIGMIEKAIALSPVDTPDYLLVQGLFRVLRERS